MASFDELQAVKRRHASELLRMPGVCGIDVAVNAQGEAAITIHLETEDPRVRQQLPDQLEGHPLWYVPTGPLSKQE
jgi:hypothetical protein